MKKLLTIVMFFLMATPASAADLAYRVPVAEPDSRVERLRAYLASYNSPLTDEAKTFVAEADRNNLDWKLVAGIAGVESTFGKEIPTNSYNAWGWGVFTGARDGVHFKDWADGIAQVSEGLRTNYYGRGAETLYDVGWRYAANGNSWATHLTYFLNQIQDFQPASPEQLPMSI